MKKHLSVALRPFKEVQCFYSDFRARDEQAHWLELQSLGIAGARQCMEFNSQSNNSQSKILKPTISSKTMETSHKRGSWQTFPRHDSGRGSRDVDEVCLALLLQSNQHSERWGGTITSLNLI
jgi:hypothetical protein